jgi:hypothetical protein
MGRRMLAEDEDGVVGADGEVDEVDEAQHRDEARRRRLRLHTRRVHLHVCTGHQVSAAATYWPQRRRRVPLRPSV